MFSGIDCRTFSHHENSICPQYRRRPVGNDDQRTSFSKQIQSLKDTRGRRLVKSARDLVQNQKVRFLEEGAIIDGTGSQVNGLERWGDYSSMSVDPLDDCTFWYTTEYIATTGSYNWNTRIASFKFENCGNSNPGFYLSATPPSQTVLTGKAITYTLSVNSYNGYNGTVGLTLSGCPQNATCTFSPSSSGSPNYPPSTLTVSTSSALAAGNYLLTVLIRSTRSKFVCWITKCPKCGVPSSRRRSSSCCQMFLLF